MHSPCDCGLWPQGVWGTHAPGSHDLQALIIAADGSGTHHVRGGSDVSDAGCGAERLAIACWDQLTEWGHAAMTVMLLGGSCWVVPGRARGLLRHRGQFLSSLWHTSHVRPACCTSRRTTPQEQTQQGPPRRRVPPRQVRWPSCYRSSHASGNRSSRPWQGLPLLQQRVSACSAGSSRHLASE
jgi:hypothetical protein